MKLQRVGMDIFWNLSLFVLSWRVSKTLPFFEDPWISGGQFQSLFKFLKLVFGPWFVTTEKLNYRIKVVSVKTTITNDYEICKKCLIIPSALLLSSSTPTLTCTLSHKPSIRFPKSWKATKWSPLLVLSFQHCSKTSSSDFHGNRQGWNTGHSELATSTDTFCSPSSPVVAINNKKLTGNGWPVYWLLGALL